MTFLRNALLRAIVLGAGTFVWATAASAVTFDTTYDVTLNASTSAGLGLAESDVVTEPTFELTTANPTKSYTSLFQIHALEACCDWYGGDLDTLPNNISVDFDFSLPTGGAGLPITGVAQGHIDSKSDYISISWNSDAIFTFDGGIRLQIELGDATLSCTGSNNHCDPYTVMVKDNPNCHDSSHGYGGYGRQQCSKHPETVYAVADVPATFTLLPNLISPRVASVTAVPLPAGLPLLASGVGLFALVARRKKRKAAA
jgi:hypothetical protein